MKGGTIKRSLVDEIAESLSVNVRDDYSGRGMYGETCFGIESDEGIINQILLGIVLRETLDTDVALDLASIAAHDSMGLGQIVYFPGWTIAEDEPEAKQSAPATPPAPEAVPCDDDTEGDAAVHIMAQGQHMTRLLHVSGYEAAIEHPHTKGRPIAAPVIRMPSGGIYSSEDADAMIELIQAATPILAQKRAEWEATRK